MSISLDLVKLQNADAPRFKTISLGKKKRFHLPKKLPKKGNTMSCRKISKNKGQTKGHQMSCSIFLNSLGLA